MITARHYVCVEGRWVHYRRRGAGPAIVLLHGSPQSGAALAPLIEACAARGLTVFAPDNPGNGCSDALPGYETDVTAYAHALHELLNALKLKRVALYGFHTGAAHAAAFAALFPARVSGLVLDGLPVWTADERADICAHYLPPFTPQPFGEHLAWLWARMEEQAIFFPWYDRRESARLSVKRAITTEALHANAMDLLRAGDGYRALYESAFVFEAEPWLARLAMPTFWIGGPDDPLSLHQARVAGLPACVRQHIGPPERAAQIEQIAHFLGQHPGDATPEPVASGVDAAGRTRGFVTLQDGRMLAYEGPHSSRAVFLPDFGESVGVARCVGEITLDLPGHGDCGGTWPVIGADIAQLAADVRPFGDALGVAAWRGRGLGGLIAQRLGGEILGEALPDAPPPSLAPRWDGAHFQTAWRYLRKRAMFRPWTSFSRADATSGDPLLNPAHLQNQLIALMQATAHLDTAYQASAASWRL